MPINHVNTYWCRWRY